MNTQNETPKIKVITTYSDPSQGWAKVSRRSLVKLKIADKISPYSYQFQDNVYLEEGIDLSIYMEAQKANGVKVIFRSFRTEKRSRIRNYENYRNF
jgi:hypothetical protein